MTHPTDDLLRDAAQVIIRLWSISSAGRDLSWRQHMESAVEGLRAALAAAPQPAPAPADERAAMIEVVEEHVFNALGETSAEDIADALLAAGWTRGGDAAGLREADDLEGHMKRARDREAAAYLARGAALARPSAPETLAWAVVGEDGQGERRVALVYDENGNVELYADPGVTVISVCDHTPGDRLYRVSPQPIPEGMLAGPIGYAGDETRADRIANAALEAVAEGVDIAASPEAVLRKVREN